MLWVMDSKFCIMVIEDLPKASLSYLIAKCFNHSWANICLSFTDRDATQVFPEEVVMSFSLVIA